MSTPAEISVATIRTRDEVALADEPARVFAVLADVRGWERWWPWLVRVQPVHVDAAVVGSVVALDPLGAPTFCCRVEMVDPPRRLRVRYEQGPYAGTGEWLVVPDGGGRRSRVSYAVDLTTAQPVLQPLGRFLDLGTIHSLLMQEVLRGLAREVARRPGS